MKESRRISRVLGKASGGAGGVNAEPGVDGFRASVLIGMKNVFANLIAAYLTPESVFIRYSKYGHIRPVEPTVRLVGEQC